jgi:hypothetical protein
VGAGASQPEDEGPVTRWLVVVCLIPVAFAAGWVVGAGVVAMDQPPRTGLPFETVAECEQFQIDERVWFPPEACAAFENEENRDG